MRLGRGTGRFSGVDRWDLCVLGLAKPGHGLVV